MLACIAAQTAALATAAPAVAHTSSRRAYGVSQQRRQRAARATCPAAAGAATCTSTAPGAAALLDGVPTLSPDFSVGQQIGRGSFAVVLEVTDDRTGARLAAKKLPRYVHGRLPSQQAELVGAEAAAQRTLSAASPAVLRLVDFRTDDNFFYLVSELCISDLARFLAQRGGGPLTERETAHIMRQLLSALSACHHAGIAFRDVKPANLLVRSIDANGMPEVALADFGCCRSTADPQPASRSSAGTPLYSAPECVHGSGGMESDLWAAGILMYHLLSGGFPFCDPRHKITQGEYWRRVAEMPISTAGPAWHGVSPGALALVRRMLDRDCNRRITADEALEDPWILDMTSSRASDWQRAGSSASLPGYLTQRQQSVNGMASNVIPLATGPLHASA